jgi:hypothetical protein
MQRTQRPPAAECFFDFPLRGRQIKTGLPAASDLSRQCTGALRIIYWKLCRNIPHTGYCLSTTVKVRWPYRMYGRHIPADLEKATCTEEGDQLMDPNKPNIEDLKSTTQQWRDKIAGLEKKAEQLEGGTKDSTLELIETLKQQQVIIEQFLKHAESERHRSWGDKLSELDRMLKDIDANYRQAMSYFY